MSDKLMDTAVSVELTGFELDILEIAGIIEKHGSSEGLGWYSMYLRDQIRPEMKEFFDKREVAK